MPIDLDSLLQPYGPFVKLKCKTQGMFVFRLPSVILRSKDDLNFNVKRKYLEIKVRLTRDLRLRNLIFKF